jgi:ATP-dependent RNA helicase DDX18/HAS1
VELKEYEFPESKLVNFSKEYEKLIDNNYYLNKMARDAYRSYLQAYTSHKLKDIFDVHALNLTSTAKSFGLTVPPKVNLSKY